MVGKMKSKMLLATPEGGVGEYTHIVRVESFIYNNSTFIGFSRLSNTPSAGTITPQDFEGFSIASLHTGNHEVLTTSLSFDSYDFVAREVYLGRESINLAEKFSLEIAMAFFSFKLFLEDDVGKDVPIWLATTPPLGIRAEACNAISLKIPA